MNKPEELPVAIDERWKVFGNTTTIGEFEDHYLYIDEISPGIGKPVEDYDRLIRQLLKLSYFEYDLITVAIKHSFIMAELALKVFYREKYGKESDKSLFELIAFFHQQKLMSEQDLLFWESIRWIRNKFTHPDIYQVHPPSSINIIRQIVTGLNNLKETLNKRII